ncbi:hypothetical protein SO802_024165 [Lithocarpus litseifolius]|uniref:Branchpoint-bridging protein n=1 Tax=Lithocarpus litseifolius TaxID=425828 RepID=A0AAW2CA97_9ROSI
MTLDDKGSSEQQEGIGSSGKRRHSRWDKVENDQANKGKKNKWISDDSQLKQIGPLQLPYFRKELIAGSELESEIQELKAELVDISRKLQTSELHDDSPMEERSPSPEPVYDYFGIRINTHQERLHQKLLQKHQHIISMLIQKNPNLQQPLEYKSSKLFKKIYIPVKEYPTYNFIGPIIGPLGNTQKRMEKETGAKIRLRGSPPVFPNITGQIASLGWTPGSILSMPLTPFPISQGLDFAPPPGLSSLSDLPGCISLHSSSNSSNQIQSTSGGLIAQFPALLKCSNWSLLKGTGQPGQHEGMQWFTNSCQQFIATIFE